MTRVPSLFHWEGRIAPGFSDKMGTHMDVAPTVMSIVSNGTATAGEGGGMHGVDLSAILLGESDEVNKFVDGSVVVREKDSILYFSRPFT